jgi:hypothetical protein
MNTFEAINRAADHIEQNPALYSFTHARTPSRSATATAVGLGETARSEERVD